GEVRLDDGSRALYSTDGSNYRQDPIGVGVPRSVQDVVEAVTGARDFGAPITMRGGGTSLAGQCCNVAIVIDCSKYLNRILDLDYQNRRARVQPGLVLDTLRNEAEKRHLTFAPDPSTHNHCTLGGMIGNNSCGVHSVMGGSTSDNVEELEIVLYDGAGGDGAARAEPALPVAPGARVRGRLLRLRPHLRSDGGETDRLRGARRRARRRHEADEDPPAGHEAVARRERMAPRRIRRRHEGGVGRESAHVDGPPRGRPLDEAI